jgi:polar amino acid transport system substrate-binding protein
MPNINGEKDILSVVETIQKELISFYTIDGSGLHLTASTGASIFPDSSSKLNLVDNAYKALSIAEKNGFARVEIFTKNQTNHSYDELKLYNDMHKALESKELEVYYQPIVNAKTRNIVAAEALVRWMHPEHGLISPFVFIPIMEKTGLIVELGKYMLDGVLSQQRRWKEFGLRQVEVSINLSMLEFETGKFVSHVDTKLKEYQVSPRLIKFEVTEGIAMINEKKTSKQLNDLRDMGIGISLDDFGTGYTSFSYLKRIPANTLKIDRSLILNIVKNEDDQQIVQGIIDLGHTLNMKIVVEGIETKDMYEKIRDMGGDFIQGYYFSKPVPVYEFQKLLN